MSVCVGVHAFGTPVGVSQGVLVLCSVCFFRYVSARGNVCLRSFACLCKCVCVCECVFMHSYKREKRGGVERVPAL